MAGISLEQVRVQEKHLLHSQSWPSAPTFLSTPPCFPSSPSARLRLFWYLSPFQATVDGKKEVYWQAWDCGSSLVFREICSAADWKAVLQWSLVNAWKLSLFCPPLALPL